MNKKLIPFTIFMFALVLVACAPMAASTSVVVQQATRPPQVVIPNLPTAVPPAFPQPLPTQAPYATPLPVMPYPGSIPTPVDNYFKNYGVNPFIDTRVDHLSTFALDVDTASYNIARSYVMDGNLPPAEAVRVEEFVNSFEQDYPIPPDVAFGIYADGAPSAFNSDGTLILRFGVQGYDIPAELRKPASLTFVIDISGSMGQDNRLGLVKQSLQLLVERLRPTDTVSIVVYSDNTRVVLFPTSGEDRTTILNSIYSLQTEGATNLEAGLRLGYQLASQAYRALGINRVILCSDGVANVGATSTDAILESIRGYADAGISLTTVGFGMGNFNDVLMEQLADKGDGNYSYVDTLEQARHMFVDNLTSTLQVIALDAKVQVDFNPEAVAYYRLIGYENRAVADQDFRNDAVDAGEIGAGHSATALYAVLLRPGMQGRIATVQLRWQDPQTHSIQEINGNFNTWDVTPTFASASPRYQLAVVVAQYAEVLRRSPWAIETPIYQVLNLAVQLSGILPGDPQVTEFVNLVSRASQIKALTDQ